MKKQETINIYNLYKEMTENNIITAFLGDFNHTTTTALLNKFKRGMAFLETSTGINKKVYKVMVECLENVSRHKVFQQNNKNVPSDLALFLFQKQPNAFVIITGNYIQKNTTDALRKHIDKINSLDKNSLQEYYREVISAPRINDNIGAGLGLIDIALKAGTPLIYHFKEVHEQYTFFTIQTTINY